MMKRVLLIILVAFFIPSSLFADQVDDDLPGDTAVRIKESARQVIRLGAENKGVIKMTKTMLENNFKEQEILEAHEILMKARKANLPEEPLMNKLHEGVAKQINAEGILKAMESIRSRYETAIGYALRYSENGGQARVMTREIAECMTAGMAKDDIDRVMEMLQNKRLKRDEEAQLATETFKTSRIMALAGVTNRNIIDIVHNALQKGYGAGEMRKLGNAFMIQSRTSSSPSDLAASYSNAIRRGITADELKEYHSVGPASGGGGPGALQDPRGFGGAGGFNNVGGGPGGSAGSAGRGRGR